MEKPCKKFVVKVLLFKKRIRQCYTLRFQAQVKVRKTVSALRDEKGWHSKNGARERLQTTIQ